MSHTITTFSSIQADKRSWQSMGEFLKESFGGKPFESGPPAAVSVVDVPYTDEDGTELQGYVALPSREWQRPLPAVVIIPYVR